MYFELRRIALRSAMPLALGLALASGGLGVGSPSTVDASQRANRQAFHDQMRTLWAGDHIVWTRCVIVSAGTLPVVGPDDLGLLPDTTATIERLLQNQTAIGNAFKPFYGEAAGDELTGLLETHINTAAELILAAKAGDGDAVADASARWYANADEIAAFLNGLNPRHWPLAAVDGLLEAHLDLTLEEAVARLNRDYEGDIAAYDKVHAQILTLADALSAGIIAQFPQKFAG
jgi:hypothetical protein